MNIKVIEDRFKDLGLKYDLESIKYLIDKGYRGEAKYSPVVLQVTDWDNTLALVEAGLKDKSKSADNIINKWLSYGYGLATLHNLMIEEMRLSGFFMTGQEMEILGLLAKKHPEMEKEIQIMIMMEQLCLKKRLEVLSGENNASK